MEFSVEIQNYMFGTRNMTVTGRVEYPIATLPMMMLLPIVVQTGVNHIHAIGTLEPSSAI